MMKLSIPNLQIPGLFGSSVGLVIRSQAVEVVVIQKSFGEMKVTQLSRVKAAGTEDRQMVEAIESAFSLAGIKPRRVAVAVPAAEVLLRYFTMPVLPKSELESAVQFEARKYLPFRLDELLWDYHIDTVGQADQKKNAVVFVGLRQDACSRIEGWLNALKVTPSVIEPASFSLARLGRQAEADSGSFMGMVDVEGDSAHIMIVKGRIPYLARDVKLAAKGSGASGEAADGTQRLDALKSELALSFDFFKREHPGAAISQLLLFGTESAIRSWCDPLAQSLGCQVGLGALPVKADDAAVDLAYASCVGLALRQFQSNAGAVGFAARRSQAQPAKPKLADAFLEDMRSKGIQPWFRPVGIELAVAAAGLMALSFVCNQDVGAAKKKLSKLVWSQPEVGMQLDGKSLEELEEIGLKVNSRLALLRNLVYERIPISPKLDSLARTLPDGVWLDKVSYTSSLGSKGALNQVLTLEGACFLDSGMGSEVEIISQFADAVKEDKRFFEGFDKSQLEQIRTSTDAKKRYSYRTFQLNCNSQGRL